MTQEEVNQMIQSAKTPEDIARAAIFILGGVMVLVSKLSIEVDTLRNELHSQGVRAQAGPHLCEPHLGGGGGLPTCRHCGK